MLNGVYSTKYVSKPVLREPSPSANSRQASDIQDRRSEFKELCNIPTANMALSFGMSPAPAIAATLRRYGMAQQTRFSKLGHSGSFSIIEDLKGIPAITKKAERKGIETIKEAKEAIHDVNRKTILTDGSIKGVSAAVGRIVNDINAGLYEIVSIRNNRAPGTPPYLSKKDLILLKSAQKKRSGKSIKMEQPLSTGFPAANIKIMPKNGVLGGEVRITGKDAHGEDGRTHLLYKMRQRRFKAANELEQQAYNDHYNLSVKGKKRLYAHYADRYAHKRNMELGIKSAEPVYPKDIPQSLSPDSLEKMVFAREYKRLIESLQAKVKPMAS